MSLVALALVLSAAVSHATWNLAAKRASDGGLAFVWLAALLATVLYSPVVLVAAHSLSLTALAVILLSGLVHLGYFLLLQRGYRLADLSVVYPLARGTGPLLSVAAAIVFLGERPSAIGLLGAAFVVAGIVIISTGRHGKGAAPSVDQASPGRPGATVPAQPAAAAASSGTPGPAADLGLTSVAPVEATPSVSAAADAPAESAAVSSGIASEAGSSAVAATSSPDAAAATSAPDAAAAVASPDAAVTDTQNPISLGRRLRAGALYGLAAGVLIAGYTVVDATAVNAFVIAPIFFDWCSNAMRWALVSPYAVSHRPEITRVWRRNWREVLLVAALGPLGYILVLYAFTIAPVSLVAPARELSIVVGVIFGWWLLREPQGMRRLCGAAVVVAGVISLALS